MDALAGALLLLAIVNIRNAWDLTLTMVRRHRPEYKHAWRSAGQHYTWAEAGNWVRFANRT